MSKHRNNQKDAAKVESAAALSTDTSLQESNNLGPDMTPPGLNANRVAWNAKRAEVASGARDDQPAFSAEGR
jgi:hypothetical protein